MTALHEEPATVEKLGTAMAIANADVLHQMLALADVAGER